MTITVGIDGYNLAMPMGTGIATYARTLASTVKHMGGKTLGVFDVDAGGDPDLQEVLFFDRLTHPMVRKKSLIARWRNWRWKVPDLVEINRGAVDRRPMLDRIPDFDRLATGPSLFAAAFRQFWRTGQMATLSLANPPDIMHWTCPVPLKLAGSRNVYTIHDLVPLRMPYMTLDNKRLFHALTRACVQAADHVCTVSEITACELTAMFPEATGKVTTTYQACDISEAADLPEHEARNVVGRLGLVPGAYFLFYGALEPKKNVARLLEAHARMTSDTPLVVVTGRSWNNQTEQALVDSLSKGSDRLIVMDFLPRGVLQALIKNARAVTFPSLHEGFGLPVLEAMRLGVPVLTGNQGGVVEVAGDAGLLVDPYSVPDILEGLTRMDRNPKLRCELASAGLEQAEKFSPDKYARRMSVVYSNLRAGI
jgi:glycosyltransferase involved in cell wall biosynthesis